MSKFCKNCGTELADEAAFCKNCGTSTAAPETAPVEASAEASACDCTECNGDCAQQEAPAAQETGFAGAVNGFIAKLKNKDKNALLITCGAALTLVIILVLAIVLSGGGAEDAADNYFKVAYKGKASKVEDLAPESYWEYADDELSVDVEDVEECIEDFYDTSIDMYEEMVGKDVSFSYEIVDTDEVGESDLDKIKDYLKSHYDIAKKDVDEAVELELEIVIEGDDDEDELEETIYAVKIDGDWYPCSKSGELKIHELVEAAKALEGLGDLGDALGGLGDLGDLGDLLG